MKEESEKIATFKKVLAKILKTGAPYVNSRGGCVYVGEKYIALVVPSGIEKIIEAASSENDSAAFWHQAGLFTEIVQAKLCVVFDEGTTNQTPVIKARIYYEKGAPQRVNVMLLTVKVRDLDRVASAEPTPVGSGTLPLFSGAIEFFQKKTDERLKIEGFNEPRMMRTKK